MRDELWALDTQNKLFFLVASGRGMWDLPLQHSDPLVVALRLSCSMACGI